jgi:hypothetical protein
MVKHNTLHCYSRLLLGVTECIFRSGLHWAPTLD